MSDFPENPFWDFSLALYRQPGVEAACIGLQDRLGLDVNLLLYACWLAATGRAGPTEDDWRRLIDATTPWRVEVVEPLRAVRRHLKTRGDITGAAALRERVKALELDAEHAQQLAIAALAPPPEQTPVTQAVREEEATANVQAYLRAAGVGAADADLADIAFLAGSIVA